jgi:hypothetical protein
LFSSPGERSDARVGEPSGIVILEGLGGGAYQFEVPKDIVISPGDIAVSSRNSLHALAIVDRVVDEADRTSKTVYARLPVAFADLRYVTIVRALAEREVEDL